MFLTYFKIGQCPFVYITICIDFLPRSLQCCPVTQSVPHTLIFPQIILYMLVEHSQVDSCQWTSQDTLAHQIKLYVVHLFYCNSLLLYKRSTCEKGKYLVLPVTYICTICSSLLQLKRKNAAYSCICRPQWDHGYSISPLPLVFFQYFKIIWTFSEQARTWNGWSMSFRSQYKVMCWICVNTIVFFVVVWIVGPLQWFQKWSCTSVSTSTA